MSVLVTGGLGYIGSHTVVELYKRGFKCIIIDNLSNSTLQNLERIERIVGNKIEFIEMDLLNFELLTEIFKTKEISSVFHFAGYKAVGESVINPVKYYENNITGTINLLKAINKGNVKKLVFSSSATVYSKNEKPPFTENSIVEANNPYGKTKLMCEELLKDYSNSSSEMRIVILRYFNPVGAHSSGLLGESPRGLPNNLMPFISKVAAGEINSLNVFGSDYPTADGTGVRDYIHVVDLAVGHVKALQYLDKNKNLEVFNLGSGKGHSVLELIKTFEKVNNIKIPFKIKDRREGDTAISYANTEKSENILGWKAEKSIEQMCKDVWKWEKNKKLLGI